MDRRVRVFHVLSNVIPVATAAALLVGLLNVSPDQRNDTFLIVVLSLMGLGMAGSWLAVQISGHLSRALRALQG